jgi:hypothetical protein
MRKVLLGEGVVKHASPRARMYKTDAASVL